MRRLGIMVVAVAAVALRASAQNKPLLDLNAAPTAPAAGTGTGTLTLADQLGADATNLEKTASADAHAKAELRRLARELLASGEKAGQAGSARIVMGRTLVAALPELDKLLAGASAQPVQHAAAADISAGRKLLESGNPDPDLVLRDALALLSKLAGPVTGVGGWVEDGNAANEPLAPKLEGWSRLPGVTPEAIESVKQIDAMAQEAETWPAFRASSIRARAMIADAAAAIESPPAWVPDASRRVLGEQYSAAIKDLSDRSTRGSGLDGLSRLAGFARLMRRTESLDDNSAGKRVRAGVALAVSIPTTQADARTMESFEQLLNLAAARVSWPDEKTLVRQLRPGFRILAAAAKQTEQQLMTLLPDVLKRPEAMTDPGMLTAISSHRRAVADVEGLFAANRAFAAPGQEGAEPVADKPWQPAANRVLKLCQDLSRADQKEAAQTSLRALFTHVELYGKLPGEDDLRRAVKEDAGKPPKDRNSVWARLSSGRDAALAAEITDRRAGWLFDWEKNFAGKAAGSDAQRLEAMRGLTALIVDAGPVTAPTEAYAALQAWPGWELSPASLATMSAGLADQVIEATRLLLAGDAAKAADATTKARKDFAVTLLAGRLANEAHRRGIAPDRSAAALLRELTAGGPIRGRSWMGRETELLDDVCRYSEEVAALRKLGAKDKADAVQRFVNLRATEALNSR